MAVVVSDPMMGAMTAGIASGIGLCFGESAFASVFKWSGEEFLNKLTLSIACDALAGVVIATMLGGDFGRGILKIVSGSGCLNLNKSLTSKELGIFGIVRK